MFKSATFLLAFSSLLFTYSFAASTQIYGNHHLIAYVVDWDFTNEIPWRKLDHIAYAFAVPDENGNLKGYQESQLQKVVSEAHTRNIGVSIAVGGWTGSLYFSSLVKSAESQKKFADNLVDMVRKYELNGVNLDWEYPNDPDGISCNQKDPQDTDNFLTFIKLLRQLLDQAFPEERKLITAAVGAGVFKGVDGKPISSLDSGWATDMDAFYIMAYDINGSWSNTTAANAPLHLGKTGNQVSGETAVQAWINAGIPSNQVFLGVPFYGYTQKTTKKMTRKAGLSVPLDRSVPQIKGDQYDSVETDPCPGAIGSYSGEMQWRTINQVGADRNTNGWATFWDKTTDTPFSYHAGNRQFVSFDNPKSLGLKTQFVKEKALGGMMLWSLEMDDSSNSLLESMQSIRSL
ncbi:glycoside hydrolase superfamily [Mycotypha africana]|uniref:glycoside hydrolase superfamily n=1 Tax=Mycotypha africana TaxID=64632 RepID=UPI002300C38A|nr:glycoside hydrolase superfamily [Mycotypha africana]KAI8969004.1 glycoside hydrolase superfamily [Mycotypha africana]